MKHRFQFLLLIATLGFAIGSVAQPTVCPAPLPNTPNCFQTSRPNQGNPLTNWPPIPNQDCCNAIPLCQPLNFIDNGVVVPAGAPIGVLFPGCVDQELPSDLNTCFSNNEKATTWYKWQIRPLPNGPTAAGSPAGKLRFKIIPLDALDDPNYDPFTDVGSAVYGNTDYDFLLFKIPSSVSSDGQACTRIKNSTALGTANSVIASCNWTGVRGPTGLFEPGTGTDGAQAPASRFNKPLSVKVGDVFYLAIDNFSVNQQGFFVDFRGLEAPDDSTAIINPPQDTLISITKVFNSSCGKNRFILRFNRPVFCDSIKPSKFSISGLTPGIQIASIQSENGCVFPYQDTSFVFSLSSSNPDTTLRITLANTIKDICGNRVQTFSRKIWLLSPGDTASVLQNLNTLTALPANALAYQWLFNGFPIPGANQQNLEMSQNGNYSVVVSLLGCMDTSMSKNYVLGIEDIVKKGNWLLFPNPAQEQFSVKGILFGKIRIFDVIGKEVYSKTFPELKSNSEISTNQIPSGLYWVEITNQRYKEFLRLEIKR